VVAVIGVQALLNLGATLGLLPILGVPLPLVSCGGTSLLTVLAGIGILLNIATNRRSLIGATADRRTRAHSGGRNGRPHGPRPGGR
jgi:cell division protein FtsW